MRMYDDGNGGQFAPKKADVPVTLYVQHQNQPPSFTFNDTQLGLKVVELQAAGTPLSPAYINVTDIDPCDSYTLTVLADANNYFTINATTQQIVLTPASVANINYFFGQRTYTITVQATDKAGATATASYTVTVLPSNRAPDFSGSTLTFYVPQDSIGKATVCAQQVSPKSCTSGAGYVQATDLNEAKAPLDLRVYSLLDNAGGRFAINASTGVITVASGVVARTINFEDPTYNLAGGGTGRGYVLTVQASSPGTGVNVFAAVPVTTTVQVRIFIMRVNGAPFFTTPSSAPSFRLRVIETWPLKPLVMSVVSTMNGGLGIQANDRDNNASTLPDNLVFVTQKLSYSLSPTCKSGSTDGSAYFTVTGDSTSGGIFGLARGVQRQRSTSHHARILLVFKSVGVLERNVGSVTASTIGGSSTSAPRAREVEAGRNPFKWTWCPTKLLACLSGVVPW